MKGRGIFDFRAGSHVIRRDANHTYYFCDATWFTTATMVITTTATPVSSRSLIQTHRQSGMNSLKRKSIVYVEIPPSPLHTSHLRQFNSSRADPLSPKAINHNRGTVVELYAPLKKRKLSAETTKRPDASMKAENLKTTMLNLTSEFPRGYFYCHQCNKKRDGDGNISADLHFLSSSQVSFSPASMHYERQVQSQILQDMRQESIRGGCRPYQG